MAAELYDQVYADWNGILFAEATKVSIEWVDNNQVVETIVKGFAGLSPSPKHIMVTFTNAVNSSGFLVNIAEKFLADEAGILRLRLGSSGKSMTSKGFFRNPKMDAGVGQTTTEDFGFIGEPASFQ